ncbi:MAG: adenylosuccinate synthase [Bacilli bacterium]
MKNSAVVVGTQWGDEGKGKITDYLASKADVVVRYQGGNNAGHTIVFNDNKYALHLIPSGIFDSSTTNVLANGMVINPDALKQELDYIKSHGFTNFKLKISDRAHIVMPYHIDLDGYYESISNENKVGTTKKGIGPAYTDKASRFGIRVYDLFDEDVLRSKIEFNLKIKKDLLEKCNVNYTVDSLVNYLNNYKEIFQNYVTDTSKFLNDMLSNNKKILFEGAQGIMLCLDHGTYPFVTSSSPTASSIPLNAGISVKYVNNVVGISKAYSTRVGEGAFPTEFEDDISIKIRDIGNEYGTTTGRPRRIGWFDCVVVKHSIRVGSIDTLSIMLLDVLTGISELQICTHYKLNGELIDYVPGYIKDFDKCVPVFIKTPGWTEDITGIKSYEDLPDNAKKYLNLIEKYCNTKISMFSVGPDRLQTVVIKEIY